VVTAGARCAPLAARRGVPSVYRWLRFPSGHKHPWCSRSSRGQRWDRPGRGQGRSRPAV